MTTWSGWKHLPVGKKDEDTNYPLNWITSVDKIQENLHRHIRVLSQDIGERSLYHYQNLNQAFQYLCDALKVLNCNFTTQTYEFENKTFHNVIVEKPGVNLPQENIIIGAHYDTVYGTPGADDNASGVATLLELIRLFQNVQPRRTIRFVAFTLEEPPIFGTPFMGSRFYAARLKHWGETVTAMMSLEMLGYYSDAKRSQDYPLPLMRLKYPEKGNFIAVVGNLASRNLVRKVKDGIKRNCTLPVESLATVRFVPGIDLSDHSSFWDFGFPAVMITDTAFYRNPHYHGPGDTIEIINFDLLTELVKGLQGAITTELDY